MHGRGIFRFANGNTYVGMFHDGAFHGEGILFFTEQNGGGQFRGLWENGVNIDGQYIFGDGLPFDEANWAHCTEDDRRFWDEYLTFIQPPKAPQAKGPTTTPDYSVTNGIPPAFAMGQPRGLQDVQSKFWSTAQPPAPEHQHKEVVSMDRASQPGYKSMSVLIAEANGDTNRDAANPKAGRPAVQAKR